MNNIDLDTYINYDVNLKSDYKNFQQITNQVWDVISESIPNAKNITKLRMKEYLGTLLCNLHSAYSIKYCVSIPRDKKAYLTNGIFGKAGNKISYTAFNKLIDIMVHRKLLHMKKGYHNSITNRRRKTRIWSTEGLINYLKQIPFQSVYSSEEKVVKLSKKVKGNRVYIKYFKKNEVYKSYEEKILKINSLYKNHRFEIDSIKKHTYYLNPYFNNDSKIVKQQINDINLKFLNSDIQKKINEFPSKNKFELDSYKISLKDIISLNLNNYTNIINKPIHIPLRNQNENIRECFFPRLVSIFCNGDSDLKYGGRLYNIPFAGINYQTVPSTIRKTIAINGSSTVEVDFSSLHIAMLYARNNKQLQVSPYGIRGDSFRPIFKKLFLVAINAGDDETCIGRLKYDHQELLCKPFLIEKELITLHSMETEQPDWKSLLQELKHNNQLISRHFCSGVGVSLQRDDSEMMLDIIHSLALEGIPALPVHDSAIVAEEDQELLIKIMQRTYSQHMNGFTCEVD